MIGKVEEMRKETEDIWRKIIKNDPLYKDAFKSSQPEEKKGLFGGQMDETQIEDHLEDQGNTILDSKTSDTPLVVDSSATPEIQQGDTAPSGNTGAKDKGDEGEKKYVGSTKAKVTKVDKGKRVADPKIFTPSVTWTPPQIPINLDGLLNLGKMFPTEKLMFATYMQSQDSQDLVKFESKEKKLILMSVDILQKVAPNVQLDSNNSSSDKLLQLINSVNTSFDSLEKFATQKVLDKFKDVRIQRFQKMIEDDRVRQNKRLQIIFVTLSEGSKLYKSCILPKFTVDINKQIGIFQGKLVIISQSFDPNVTLTRSVEGQIIALNDQIQQLTLIGWFLIVFGG